MSNKAKLRLELVLRECEAKMASVNPDCVLHIRCSGVDGLFRAFHVGPGLNHQYVGSTLEGVLRNMADGVRSER